MHNYTLQSHQATVCGYIQPEIKTFTSMYEAKWYSEENKTIVKLDTDKEKYTYILDGEEISFVSWNKDTGEMVFKF